MIPTSMESLYRDMLPLAVADALSEVAELRRDAELWREQQRRVASALAALNEPSREEWFGSDAESVRCPKCREGFAGTDHTGEAMDCHYCDGDGHITAIAHCDLRDRFEALVGDAMYHEIKMKELTGVESVLAEVLETLLYSTNDSARDKASTVCGEWLELRRKARE